MSLKLVDDQAYQAAQTGLQLLDKRAVTENSMRDYLEQRGFNTAAVNDAISEFTRHRWLDDSDYAAELLRQKASKTGMSQMKLRAEMAKRGLTAEQINTAWNNWEAQNPDWELTQARKFISEKLAKQQNKVDFTDREQLGKLRQKLWRLLAARGYPSQLCSTVIRETIEAHQKQ